MVKAKRARTVETPKQPSFNLRLRAPYFYPDRQTLAVLTLSAEQIRPVDPGEIAHVRQVA
jgi:hypothetical protein